MTQPVSRVRVVRPEGGAAAWAQRLGAKHPFEVANTENQRVVTFNLARSCQDPLVMRAVQGSVRAGDQMVTDVKVRCRRCAACLQARRREWVARTMGEFAIMGPRRTWFVTLTVQPAWRHRHQAAARAWYGPGWDSLPREKQRALELRALSATVTGWLKRFRISSEREARAEAREAPKIRYVMAFEEHPTSGEWHCHVLVHEVSGQVRERTFRASWWPVGFAQAKLVKSATRAAFYVSWYLEGHPGTRMRASIRYGHGGSREASGSGNSRRNA